MTGADAPKGPAPSPRPRKRPEVGPVDSTLFLTPSEAVLPPDPGTNKGGEAQKQTPARSEGPQPFGGKQACCASLGDSLSVRLRGGCPVSRGGRGDQGSQLPVCLFHGLLFQTVFQGSLVNQEGGVFP